MIKSLYGLFLVCALVITGTAQPLFADNAEFPGRDRFPDIHFFEIDELNNRYGKINIVDVRSDLEFNTLHIKDAINIPLSSDDFVERMQNLLSETRLPLVTYCNGKTCMKSYKAARKAIDGGIPINEITVFDAGVFDWTKKYPEKAVLLGKNPTDPKQLISKKQLNEHMLDPMTFGEKAHSGTGIVLDVRDDHQRVNSRLFIGIEKSLSLSDTEKLKEFINQSNKLNKPLYIYDNTGKQVRWLMYQLEANKAKEYYFMKDGVHGYFEKLTKQLSTQK